MRKENFFHKIDTEDKAYWLGMMATDGTNNTKTGRIAISQTSREHGGKGEENRIHLQKFADIFGVNVKHCKEKYSLLTGSDKGARAGKYIVSFNNKVLSNDLSQKGVVRRKTYADMTQVFRFVPMRLMHHFVRGLFDGDGSIFVPVGYEHGQCPRFPILDFTCHSKKFLEELKIIICKKTKATDRYKITANRNSWALRWRSEEDIIKIRKWFYKDATIYLGRKKKNCDRVVKKRRTPYTCRFYGVKWDQRCGKWRVDIFYTPGKKTYCGVFDDAKEAAIFREKEVIKYNLTRCKLNFPKGF